MKKAFIGIKVEPEMKTAISEVAESRHLSVSSYIREQLMKDDELSQAVQKNFGGKCSTL